MGALSEASGSYQLIEERFPLDGLHGQVRLDGIRTVEPDLLALAAGDGSLSGFDPGSTVFFDLETTGLSSRSGACAFLVGCAHLRPRHLVTRQYLLLDPEGEEEMLHDAYGYLREFKGLVTYNGKSFDLPLLCARFRAREVATGLPADYHLDLLHTTRRFWRTELPSCRLKDVERGLMGLCRTGDVEGWEIPPLFLEFLRCRERVILDPVLFHNLLDVKSLVALTILTARRAEEGRPSGGSPAASPLEGPAVVRGNQRYLAQRRLSLILSRKGRREEAARVWREMLRTFPGDPFALVELAKHLEHRAKEPGRALELVERGLALSAGCISERRRNELLKRRLRLLRKTGRKA